uniref:Nucleotide-diphospho-sugar transferase domain-containing protein n=1 Tax=viral metagenome TaxID=1070528 RepID=A0A6C0HT95_9ZZZZ
MHLFLDNMKYYFLTCNNEIRKQHMLSEFKDYDITEVNSVFDPSKNKSGAIGFSRILDLATLNQDPSKPFQPFVIFEDDVKKYREFPKTIEIPDNTDILYIGLSCCAMKHDSGACHVCFTNTTNEVIKIYNMLALHGIIICSPRGLLAIQKCMLEGYFKDIIWDIFTAQIQPFYNVYALKTPLVYQFGEIGGHEAPTKFEYPQETVEQKIDPLWINYDNISTMTCFKK